MIGELLDGKGKDMLFVCLDDLSILLKSSFYWEKKKEK